MLAFSTVPTFKAALVSAMSEAAPPGTSVSYGWQPWGRSNQLFLGDVDAESDIPTIKAGRKFRDETYRVDVVARVASPDATPYTADLVEQEAFDLIAVVDSILADSPQLTGVIRVATVEEFTSTLVPLEKGWGCEIAARIKVVARLI